MITQHHTHTHAHALLDAAREGFLEAPWRPSSHGQGVYALLTEPSAYWPLWRLQVDARVVLKIRTVGRRTVATIEGSTEGDPTWRALHWVDARSFRDAAREIRAWLYRRPTT